VKHRCGSRRGVTFIDVLLATTILGVGGFFALALMSSNTARVRRTEASIWAQKVLLDMLTQNAQRSFAELEQAFSSPQQGEITLKKLDPKAVSSGIPESLYDGMRIRRFLVHSAPSTMPEIAFLEGVVQFYDGAGGYQEVRASRLLVNPILYAKRPTAATAPVSDPGKGSATPRLPTQPRPVARDPRVAEDADDSSPDGKAAEDAQLPQGAYTQEFVERVKDMIHDANHRGELAMDVGRLLKSCKATQAGQDGRYNWGAVGDYDYDPDYRLKLMQKVIAEVEIPDGLYDYGHRAEALTVDHQKREMNIYDLVGDKGAKYLLVRATDPKAGRDEIEARDAFFLGVHKVVSSGQGLIYARVWSSRRRLYVFMQKRDATGRPLPFSQQVRILTLHEPLDEMACPQVLDAKSKGYIADDMKKGGVEVAPTETPANLGNLSQLLGA
jgi:hypothetical protein